MAMDGTIISWTIPLFSPSANSRFWCYGFRPTPDQFSTDIADPEWGHITIRRPRLKTLFSRKKRPFQTRKGEGRLEKIIERSAHDLTVFKRHFGKLTLKMYDKGDRALRVEIIVNHIEALRCGRRLEKRPGLLERLQKMGVEFLGVAPAARLSFLNGHPIDDWAGPSGRGQRRRAGVDLQKPRMRAVAAAVVALVAPAEG